MSPVLIAGLRSLPIAPRSSEAEILGGCFGRWPVRYRIHSCQCSMGSWLVMMVARWPARSSMISSRSARVWRSIAAIPQSSNSRTSVFFRMSS